MALLLAAACNRETPQTQQFSSGTDSTAHAPADPMAAVSAEKDSLLRIVAENSKLMSEISTELSKVKAHKKGVMPVKSGESPLDAASSRDSIMARIRDVTARVNESETRLAQSQRRIRSLAQKSDTLQASVISLEASIADFQAVIENQKTTISSLTDQLNTLQNENQRLTSENVVLTTDKTTLTDTLAAVTTRENTVYYVVGTKQDLIQKGVLVEEGSKFLFFGHKTLQPARTLNQDQFTAADKRQLAEIPLQPEKKYRILTRQNPEYLSTKPDDGGKLSGSLAIAAADAFWAPSKYLIVVED
jgi:archaellum component FlaC